MFAAETLGYFSVAFLVIIIFNLELLTFQRKEVNKNTMSIIKKTQREYLIVEVK